VPGLIIPGLSRENYLFSVHMFADLMTTSCGRFGCGHFGLWPFWIFSVAVLV